MLTIPHFLYRFGDPARYGQGDPPKVLENWDSATTGHKQMGGSHDAHWIAPGLPGAGRLMVFNNGQYLYQRTPQSSILEIDPFLGAGGDSVPVKYINPVTRDGPVKVLGDVLPMTNSAFRAYRYGTGHPAFKGRVLKAEGTITERAEQGIDTYQKRRPPAGGPRGGQGRGGQGAKGQGAGGQGGGGKGSEAFQPGSQT